MEHNQVKKNLITIFLLTQIFFFVEVIVGFLSNSLALLADAGHMLSDVMSLGLSVFALIISNRPNNERFTFGYYRAEILVALFNGSSLLVISGFIVFEAVERIGQPQEVLGVPMLIAAFLGLLINIYGVYILKDHHHDNLNVSSAFFHIFADLLGSVAALLAGILILVTGNPIWDIILSVVITLLIVTSGFNIIKKAIFILMQATPPGLDSKVVTRSMIEIPLVDNVHDLHIWSVDQKRVMVSAHVVVSEGLCQHDRQEVMISIREKLHDEYNINHSTIQIEHPAEQLDPEKCSCN
jgi:cobalt-zinc-cadmium efflux system protein